MTQSPTTTFDGRNLALRLSTSAVFAVLFLSLLYAGSQPWAKLAYLLLMSVSVCMGVREMCLIARKAGQQPSMLAATLTALLFPLHFYISSLDTTHPIRKFLAPLSTSDPLPLWLVLVLGGLIIHFGMLLFRKDPLENALGSQAITWMAALYMGLGLGFQQKLFMFNDTTLTNTGARLILALFLIVWLGDTTAYFVGSTLGRHKLAPKVSPKKTWEGAAGNLAGNIGGAFLARTLVCHEWSVVDVISLGILLGIAGQLGDLVESTWKRSANVKDSAMGLSIPGHGGMLDRVDSLVFAAPILYAYVHFVHGLN
jgi:phosphatidate cytidylyltransferase